VQVLKVFMLQKHIDSRFTMPMVYCIASVVMLLLGGASYFFRASTPADAFIHDGYVIDRYIHYVVFAGLFFAGFAGISYWYPKMFGRMMNKTLGRIHFWITFIVFNFTFFPMHFLGVGGHMRRIYDPNMYSHLMYMQPINTFETVSAIVLAFAQLIFVFNIIYSLFRGEKAGSNPWLPIRWSS
jgi:cytochrome c oxidase subunit I